MSARSLHGTRSRLCHRAIDNNKKPLTHNALQTPPWLKPFWNAVTMRITAQGSQHTEGQKENSKMWQFTDSKIISLTSQITVVTVRSADDHLRPLSNYVNSTCLTDGHDLETHNDSLHLSSQRVSWLVGELIFCVGEKQRHFCRELGGG